MPWGPMLYLECLNDVTKFTDNYPTEYDREGRMSPSPLSCSYDYLHPSCSHPSLERLVLTLNASLTNLLYIILYTDISTRFVVGMRIEAIALTHITLVPTKAPNPLGSQYAPGAFCRRKVRRAGYRIR